MLSVNTYIHTQMILQEMAIRAAAALTQEINLSSLPELRTTLRNRRSRIIERFRIVYVRDLCQWRVLDEDVVEYDGEYYAVDSCLSCEDCDALVPVRYTYSVYTRHGLRSTRSVELCRSCYECSDLWCCEGCNSVFTDEVDCHDLDGDNYCPECYTNHCDAVPSYHGARRWCCETSKPSYSFELELVAEDRPRLIKLLNERGFSKVSWERDGSLPSETGLEILIQHRPSLERLCLDTWEIVDAFRGKGCAVSAWNYLADGKSGCGMHLNANKDARWRERHVMRLLYVVLRCQREIVKIAGRNSEQWATWPDSRNKLLRRWARGEFGKYLCIRVGCDRMEWRCFRATLNLMRIKMYCDTVSKLEELALSNVPAVKLVSEAKAILNQIINSK